MHTFKLCTHTKSLC